MAWGISWAPQAMHGFAFWLLCSLSLSAQGLPPPAFQQQNRRILKRLEALGSRAGLHPARRGRLGGQIAALMEPFNRRVGRLLERTGKQRLSRAARRELGAQVLAVLGRWVALEDPDRVRVRLGKPLAALSRALGSCADTGGRRAFLGEVITRLAASHHHSDLAVLVAVVDFDVLFLRELGAGRPQLQALSQDLLRLFTEIGSGEASTLHQQLYRPGRFKDTGFRPEFRDGSDQVRHFCGALWMFSLSSAHALTERLLHWKEVRDAARRKLPLDQADLRLNHAARQIVERLAPPDAAPVIGTRSRSRPVLKPPPIKAWPGILMHLLGAGQ